MESSCNTIVCTRFDTANILLAFSFRLYKHIVYSGVLILYNMAEYVYRCCMNVVSHSVIGIASDE